ncbi:hypothetical protein BJP34_33465 [Moorena producens PAL-8-15-08-1]|uniref:Uncharacterized protein n=1 Tax=Moorena producens PAL-8-15-08-1 TaxID=1458985 RepID=A0A1D8U1A4_9CYAN|nr:hypothetical protein BJP34_33465 [Moorena producens PAL-8-15-08-1]
MKYIVTFFGIFNNEIYRNIFRNIAVFNWVRYRVLGFREQETGNREQRRGNSGSGNREKILCTSLGYKPVYPPILGDFDIITPPGALTVVELNSLKVRAS